jgi:pimeloyl-ACP methyl ester carboxylesterase
MTTATNLEPRSVGGTAYYLVHGLAGGAENWCEVVPHLVDRYRVIAVDLPGHAASEAPPRGASMDDFAAVVAAVLDAEGVERAVVAGHSFGGLVALRLARTRPELVRGLLLVAPAGIATARKVVDALVLASTTVRPGRAAARLRHRFAERAWYRRAVFRPWFVADADALSPRATHGLLSAQARHTNTRVAGRAMVAGDPRRELGEIACPVLVLWGARDAQLPLDDALEYTRRLRARLRIVADCGHLVIVERPHAVVDGIEELAA